MQEPASSSSSSSQFCANLFPIASLQWKGHTIAAASKRGTIHQWDSRRLNPRCNNPLPTMNHAAAKGLEFCPFQSNTIATGGANGIKFWNAQTGSLRGSIPTHSPVTSVLWSPHRHEIMASYGNFMSLWSVSSSATRFQQMAEWTLPDDSKVLSLDRRPESGRLFSLHSDDSLYGWDAFGDPPPQDTVTGLRTSGWLESAPVIR
jgi:cell division cycle protein 20 (cofactor of APC complex)